MYLLTLLSPMSMPSLSSSPWMRGAPQLGFSRHILRARSRTSREMAGRPGWPRRTFQVQNSRKPARCQAMTCTWRIDTVAVKRSDPRNALRLGTETSNDSLEVLPRLTGYRNQNESLTNQAATGV